MQPKQGCFAASEYFVHEMLPKQGFFALPECFVHEMPPKQGCFAEPEYFVHEMLPKHGCFPEPERSGDRNGWEELTYGHKKRVSLIYRTATTAYPCYLPVLGEFCRSWSYMTYPGTKVVKFIYLPNKMRQDASLAGNFVFFYGISVNENGSRSFTDENTCILPAEPTIICSGLPERF